MTEDDRVEVEWHEDQRLWTIAVRGVDFDDLRDVFVDERRLEFEDQRRDYAERRWRSLCPVDDRLMHVTYTWRGTVRRIISGRRANAREQRLHEREWAHRARHTPQ